MLRMPSDVTHPLLSIHKGFDGIRNHPAFVEFPGSFCVQVRNGGK